MRRVLFVADFFPSRHRFAIKLFLDGNMHHGRGYHISEAAAAAGFGDLAYFNCIFKRYTGHSPRQHRARRALPAPKSDK